MIFELGPFTLDIDVPRTRAFYRTAQNITDGCNCQGCRNYAAWAERLSGEPRTTLEAMGIDLTKAPEVYVNGPNEDGTLFYGGLYHLCGRIVRGPEIWTEWENRSRSLREEHFVPLADRFRIGFTQDICLLEKDFPAPVIQLELVADLPLVLPEQCSY